jgi:hypothetical protein
MDQQPKKQSNSRMTIDFRGLVDRINTHRSDPAWRGLTFAAKVRALVEIALKSDRPIELDTTIAKLIADYWNLLADSEINLTLKRLKLLREGEYPDNHELHELSAVLPLDLQRLTEIRDRVFIRETNNSKTNGIALSSDEQAELLRGFLNSLIDTNSHNGYSIAEISEVLGRQSDRDVILLVQKLRNGNGSKSSQQEHNP